MKSNRPNRIAKKRLIFGCSLILFIGIIFLVAAAVLFFYVKSKVKEQIINEMIIKNETSFSVTQTETFRKYYFFEVLNSDALVSGTTNKARLRERGPYVYENRAEKKNIQFSNDSTNLTYTTVNTFYFRSDLSNGSEFERFTMLNLPLVAAVDRIESGELELNPIFLNILNLQLKENTNVFINRSVYDLLYGYSDFLVETIDQFQPGVLKDRKFSLLNKKNGTDYQNLTILTGKSDVNKVGSIVAWNNLKELPFWDTQKANRIKGTDGSYNGPFKSNSDKLYIFNSDLCRSVEMPCKRENEVYGVKVLDFVLPNDLFHNTTENEGFFNNTFIGNGVFNIKKCLGYPVYLSQPHFLNAENSFINSIEGMDLPNDEKHNTFIKIYPTLGVTIYANTRIQLNFRLEKSTKIDLFNNVTEILLPILWFEDETRLNSNSKSKLLKLNQTLQLIHIFPLVLVIVGSMLVFFAISSCAISFIYFKKFLISSK